MTNNILLDVSLSLFGKMEKSNKIFANILLSGIGSITFGIALGTLTHQISKLAKATDFANGLATTIAFFATTIISFGLCMCCMSVKSKDFEFDTQTQVNNKKQNNNER